jgi:transcription elongation factor GreB
VFCLAECAASGKWLIVLYRPSGIRAKWAGKAGQFGASGRRAAPCENPPDPVCGKRHKVSKAFVKESADEEEEAPEAPPLPAGTKNYMTLGGYRRLRHELAHLVTTERPEVVRTVSWAASNGDRSENGDYIYGKKRLREIDRRIRFLTKRLELAEVVDPAQRGATDQVFFGATVVYENAAGTTQQVTIVGVDEVDPQRRRVSWIAPIARALLKAREGDTVQFQAPSGLETLEILEVRYEAGEEPAPGA